MAERIDVMISSTALDLPDYRKHAIDAILRMGMHPIAMEHLAAMSADAIDASLKMVDDAEIYIGIFAHRYGYIPDSPKNPDKLSVTELEYRRAVERDIPRLIFIIDENAPVSGADLEKNPDGAAKLLRLKDELLKTRVVKFFENPDQFREHVITALSAYRQRDSIGASMHYVSGIPKPPEPYIAHPYTLLQTAQLAGRQKEMNLLTDWVAKPDSEVYKARILNIVAIGGMGKSALTWKWFNEVAPQEMKPMAGSLWWSFYESDARWENFIIRALAYVTGKPYQEIEAETNPIDRENALLRELNEKPYLLVLDGLERILVAYARMDAAYLADDELDEQTANRVAGALGLPESAGQSFVGKHQLRKTADPRTGNFLRKLASVKSSRILVSTRLYPADLQTVTGGTLPGSFAYFLLGLDDDSALDLWRALGVSGSRDTLLPMFQRFDNYPLLIRALAGEVARFRRVPGGFDAWKAANPDFEPFKVELVQVKSHVLYHSLQGLDEKTLKVLHTVAAFRMPASYDTLNALLVKRVLKFKSRNTKRYIVSVVESRRIILNVRNSLMENRRQYKTGLKKKRRIPTIFQTEQELDFVLAELEDRGLLGWDRRSNRYDLHPIVRGVVWGGLDETTKSGVYGVLEAHFASAARPKEANTLEKLMPAIELYNSLIGLRRYDDAAEVFFSRLDGSILWFANPQRISLLEMLFLEASNPATLVNNVDRKPQILAQIAHSYKKAGFLSKAIYMYSNRILLRPDTDSAYAMVIGYKSETLAKEGSLHQAIKTILDAKLTKINDEFINDRIAWIVCIIGRMLSYTVSPISRSDSGKRILLLQKKYNLIRYEDSFASQIRLFGMAALGMGELITATDILSKALIESRLQNDIETELESLVALAELERRRGNLELAREHLADTWEACERAPYRLIHADGMNVLAQIERDAGNTDAAIAAATKAYELAWCDGISEDGEHCYAYWWGLKDAEKHLTELGAPIPKLPPFDPAAHDPLPEIDWDALLKSDDLDSDLDDLTT